MSSMLLDLAFIRLETSLRVQVLHLSSEAFRKHRNIKNHPITYPSDLRLAAPARPTRHAENHRTLLTW